MQKMITETQANPLFAARLTPHRSLTPSGIRLVVAIAAVLSFIPGITFFAMGAWPVIGFMGLDVLVLYWALSHSFRGGKRFELVTLWPEKLEILQVSATGTQQRENFTPASVKLVIDRDIDEHTTAIHLRSPDRDLEIGSFLHPDDKASFAKAFGTALRKARG
jgi:uncharacterized membrane protein